MESSNNKSTACDDCMICLCSMNVPTDTITTNCGHMFHMDCISIWYDKQGNEFSCPACRESLISTPKIIYDTPESNNTLCTYFDGATIEGVRENDEFIGHCKLTEPAGYIIEGVRKNGKFIGQCKLIDGDRFTIEGLRNNSGFIGHSKVTYSNGKILEGVLDNGDFVGERKMTFVNGEVQYGIIRNGEFVWITRIFQYNKNLKLIKTFDSMKICVKSLKIARKQIGQRLRNEECPEPLRYPANYYANQYIFRCKEL